MGESCRKFWGTSDDVVAHDRHGREVTTTISLQHVCGQDVGDHLQRYGYNLHTCEDCTATFNELYGRVG